jgi:hypothetical protein
MLLSLVIALVFALIFGVGLLGFFWHLRQSALDREVDRRLKLTRFHYDRNGNPESFYDELTGQYFVPAPGNNPNQPAENTIFHPVRVERITPQRDIPSITSNGVEVNPASNDLTSKLPEEDRKLLFDLVALIEGGQTPTSAIKQLTGASGGRTYQKATNLLKLYEKGVFYAD